MNSIKVSLTDGKPSFPISLPQSALLRVRVLNKLHAKVEINSAKVLDNRFWDMDGI